MPPPQTCRLTRHIGLWNYFKGGFTLAEVLITLGVIGVVAAITIPTLVNNIQDRHFKALWKRTFSEISNAYEHAFAENPVNVPSRAMYDTMALYSKEIYYQVFSRLTDDYCIVEGTQGKVCPSNYVKMTNLSPNCGSLNPKENKEFCYFAGAGGYAQLKSGVRIYAQGYLWSQPAFLVDVNGIKGPNIVGRDMFIVLFRGNKVIPGGAQGYELKGCDPHVTSNNGNCGPHEFAGSGCGAKYLYE